ncbi:aminodeoxychorismate synthase, component I [Mycolicibacterium chubuense NBB4]|uniref:Aminodeoxychorismate synthase, component I n=1 Tax=Mycolicibacterium chubuense (strain NBB4) TaxID=710421 RepID=I4BNR3_MYCCN|nr:aminodeoxychorismate synthase component I [Mycolicibacterium chubuense]AFM18920.1 aminodeoxychorismate synthase, component I [Mycolicibacterium chubuense NBB4]
MRIDRLGRLGDAPAVLRALAAATSRLGLAPPSALIGEWFGSRAVIAPSVPIRPVDPRQAFDAPVGDRSGAVGGGWFGYLSYPDRAADGRGPRIPEAAGGWSDTVLRCDRDDTWWHESLCGAPVSDWVIEALQRSPDPWEASVRWGQADRAAHRRGVRACLDAIAAGEVYQACVCTQFTGTLHGHPCDYFAGAVARTAPARAAYVAGDWGAVASLSPELFLRRCGESVTSSPIKGTLPAHADPAGLRTSVKDVAENIMIVDLVRNDLGRVARTGSVTVPELLAIRPAPGVWHLVSTVAAAVPVEVPMATVLDATFPPASVTGTPKGRARALLTEWEPVRRGIYCGTVGLASPVAGVELNVAIRTVEFCSDGTAVLGVGGGITADSDPEREWEECLHKAAPIIGYRPQSRARSTAS